MEVIQKENTCQSAVAARLILGRIKRGGVLVGRRTGFLRSLRFSFLPRYLTDVFDQYLEYCEKNKRK